MSDIIENNPNPAINPTGEAVPAPPVSYYQPPVTVAPKMPPFAANIKDGIFALFTFILGYFFCRWVLTSFFGWGAAVFTVVFLGSVLAYLRIKGVRLSAESWFWFAVTALTGLSFALWNNIGLIPLRSMFLFCAAVYWVVSATATQISGQTSNFLFFDGLNAVCIIPFRNFINQYRALGVFKGSREGRKNLLPVILGIALALIVLLIVTPQLLRADSGGFSSLITGFLNLFRFDWPKVIEFLFYCLLAVPTAAYLFGLVSGSAVKRGTDAFTAEKSEKAVSAVKITAPVTINIVLGAVCVLYVIFIACQLPYFFSAFTGSRPEGWRSFSEYARQGFFELCGVAAINLAILLAANILSKKPRSENIVLKIFNSAMALITLLLIATAFSKMALYIDAFGLTILRILPCAFMILLAFVCVAVVVLQKVNFSIVRAALITGAVLFAALCLADMDGLVVRYNTDRYLDGTLGQYDTDILYRAGPAGVPYALEVYSAPDEEDLKSRLWVYLKAQNERAEEDAGTYRDTLQSYQARATLRDVPLG